MRRMHEQRRGEAAHSTGAIPRQSTPGAAFGSATAQEAQ
jgi:hypothetical protein